MYLSPSNTDSLSHTHAPPSLTGSMYPSSPKQPNRTQQQHRARSVVGIDLLTPVQSTTNPVRIRYWDLQKLGGHSPARLLAPALRRKDQHSKIIPHSTTDHPVQDHTYSTGQGRAGQDRLDTTRHDTTRQAPGTGSQNRPIQSGFFFSCSACSSLTLGPEASIRRFSVPQSQREYLVISSSHLIDITPPSHLSCAYPISNHGRPS